MEKETDMKALKASFLGPKAENEAWVRAEFQGILDHWFRWRKGLFTSDAPTISRAEKYAPDYLRVQGRISEALGDLTEMLEAEIPKFPPRYIGHMVSELALPALFGHFASLLHNPNITSKEAARVASVLEEESIAMLGEMVGFDRDEVQGHVTGGGTVANFEAIWRARYRLDHWLSLALYLVEEKGHTIDFFDAAHMSWETFDRLVQDHDIKNEVLRRYSGVAANPFDFADRINKAFCIRYRGPVLLVPQNKHFSWAKGTNLFGFGEEAFWPVALDENGKLDVADLEAQIARARAENRPVLMVVSVAGTTEAAEIDPVHRVCDLLDGYRTRYNWNIWHHVDAAYGGFFCSVLRGRTHDVLTAENADALRSISRVHSVTIDPHKLGYVPYACGAILVKDAKAYTVSSFRAPYLERQHVITDKWSTTLEGSRAATGASAVWLMGRSLGFDGDGLGAVIASSIRACRRFKATLVDQLTYVRPLEPTDTNILCFSLADTGDSLRRANARTEKIYDFFVECPDFSVSKTTLSTENHGALIQKHVSAFEGDLDDNKLVLLRCVFMNPFWSEEGIAEQLTGEIANLIATHYPST